MPRRAGVSRRAGRHHPYHRCNHHDVGSGVIQFGRFAITPAQRGKAIIIVGCLNFLVGIIMFGISAGDLVLPVIVAAGGLMAGGILCCLIGIYILKRWQPPQNADVGFGAAPSNATVVVTAVPTAQPLPANVPPLRPGAGVPIAQPVAANVQPLVAGAGVPTAPVAAGDMAGPYSQPTPVAHPVYAPAPPASQPMYPPAPASSQAPAAAASAAPPADQPVYPPGATILMGSATTEEAPPSYNEII